MKHSLTLCGRFLPLPALVLLAPLISLAADNTTPTPRPDQQPEAEKTYPFGPKPEDIRSHAPPQVEAPSLGVGVGAGTGPILAQQPAPVEVSKMIGARVDDVNGHSVGHLNEMVINSKGQVSHVIVAVGGFLGMAARYYPVPWGVIDFDPTQLNRAGKAMVTLRITRDRLLGAPQIGARTVDRSSNLYPGPDREETPLTRSDAYFKPELSRQ